MELDGARVLLTGGSRGIGPFIARALLVRGARVTLAARSADDLEGVRHSIGSDRVATVAGDVASEEDREAMVAEAEAAFGPTDVLVNNAGIEAILPFPEYTEDDIHAMVATNLDAPIQLCRLVVPGMLARGRGHIVNVASLAGKAPTPYNTVYAATKHGLIGFTYSLRAELHATGVSASAVCPAFVAEAGFVTAYTEPNVSRGLGTETSPRRVARAVVRAIERDKPDVVVAGALPQFADVSLAISPRLTTFLARRLGGYDSLRREAQARARRRDTR
ncbi:MAG: SDR family NAD(P)-dependent oxidoreductase [Actinomycetota bacterium]